MCPGYGELRLPCPPCGPAFPGTEPRSTTRPPRALPAATDFANFRLVGAVFVPKEGPLGGGLVMGFPEVNVGAGGGHHPPVLPATHAVLT